MKKWITYGMIGVSLVCAGVLARPDVMPVFAEPDHHISVQGCIGNPVEEENTSVSPGKVPSAKPGSVPGSTPNGGKAPANVTKQPKPERGNRPSGRIPFGGKPQTGDRIWFLDFLMLMAGGALLLLVFNTTKYHRRMKINR